MDANLKTTNSINTMKKIFFSFLAIAALASCAKTEVAYVEADSEIKLMPATSLATKANVNGVIDGTAYPTAENFDVYGYWSADWNGNGAVVDYLLTNEGGAEFEHNNGTWAGITPYHWPKDGSLKFAAYSPASENFAHDYATDTYSKVGFTQESNTANTIDLLFAKTTADYTSMTAAAGVPVVFEHALAWITLEVVAADATAAQAFDIKKVTIEDVYTQADAKITMADGIQAGEWSNHAAAAPYVVFEGSQPVTETAAAIESTAKGSIVIPQAPTTVTINYNQNEIAGSTAALPDQTIVLDLALEGDKIWEPGKHYKYYLIFGLDEILISPVVVDWDDAPNTEVPTEPTEGKVISESQFVSAVNAGGVVTLGRNLNLTQPVVISKDVVINLNGKKISAENIERLLTVTNGAKVTIIGAGEVAVLTHGVGTESNPVAAIYVENGELNLQSAASIVATDDNGGYIDAIQVAQDGKLIGNNSTIKAVSKTGITAGVRSYGLVELEECSIYGIADHTANAAGTAIATTGRGLVIEDGELVMTDSYAFGSYNGALIKGDAIIDGGTYEGYGAGGFYIASTNEKIVIKNASMRMVQMPDGFVADNVAGTNGAGLYIGVGANNEVYVDNCKIYGTMQPIVMRDPSYNLGNKLFISDSEINLDYTHRGIRNDGTSYVYFGAGNNFDENALGIKHNFEYTGADYGTVTF